MPPIKDARPDSLAYVMRKAAAAPPPKAPPVERPTVKMPAAPRDTCGIPGPFAALTLRGYALEIIVACKEGRFADAENMLKEARIRNKTTAMTAAIREK